MKNHPKTLLSFSLITLLTPMVLLAQPAPIQVEFDEYPGGVLTEKLDNVIVNPGPTLASTLLGGEVWNQPSVGSLIITFTSSAGSFLAYLGWQEPEDVTRYNLIYDVTPTTGIVNSDASFPSLSPPLPLTIISTGDGGTLRNGEFGVAIYVIDHSGVQQPADVTFFDHGDAPETVPTLPLLATAGISLVLLRRYTVSTRLVSLD